MRASSIKPPMFLGTNIFSNNEYENIAQTPEQLEELEKGEVDDNNATYYDNNSESEDLVEHAGIIISSPSQSRIARTKRVFCCVLATTCVSALLAISMWTIRQLYVENRMSATAVASNGTVYVLCSPIAISTTEGLHNCENACTVASCCYAKENNCFTAFPSFCKEFASCNILKQVHDSLPPAPADLESSCHFLEESSKSKTQQFENCEEACTEAWCCFPSAGERNCYLDNVDICSGYVSCSRIRSETVGPPSTDTPLSPREEACQPENLKDPTSKQICQALCESFACCFVPDSDGEMCDSDSKCTDTGAPCAILYQVKSTENGQEVDNLSNDPGLKVMIEGSCDRNHFPDTQSECEDLCNPATCCFNSERNCDSSEGIECKIYSPCKVLYDDLLDEATGEAEQNSIEINQQQESGLSQAVEEACDFNHFPDSKSDCEGLCSTAKCCFESTDLCDLTEELCNIYKPCNVLYDDILMEPGGSDKIYFNGATYIAAEVERNVYNLCISSDLSIQEQREACEATCKPATCCFLSGEASCQQDRICSSFTECKVLANSNLAVAPEQSKNVDQIDLDNSGTGDNIVDENLQMEIIINGNAHTKQEIMNNVLESCTNNDLSISDNRLACETTCEPGDCCFIDGENSCKSAEFCDVFIGCKALSNLSKGTLPDENPFGSKENAEESENAKTNSDLEGNYVETDEIIINGNAHTKQEIMNNVLDSCTNNDLSIRENRLACETTCEPGDCCFIDGENSCKSAAFCEVFIECKALSNLSKGTLPDENPFGSKENAEESENAKTNSDLQGNYVDPTEDFSSSKENAASEEKSADPDLELDKQNTSSLLNVLNEISDAPPSEATSGQVSEVVQESPEVVNDNGTPEQFVDEGNSSPVDQGSTIEDNTGVTEDQYQTVDQSASSENSEGQDNEEIFIHGEKYTKAELAAKVQNACADLSLEENRQACADLCEPAECCNADGSNGCKGDPFCDAFVSCSALAVESGNAVDGKVFFVDGHKYTASEMERKVHDKCAAKDLSIQKNRDACRDLCKLGKCCFMSGEKSCKGDQFCSAFTDCEELIL